MFQDFDLLFCSASCLAKQEIYEVRILSCPRSRPTLATNVVFYQRLLQFIQHSRQFIKGVQNLVSIVVGFS